MFLAKILSVVGALISTVVTIISVFKGSNQMNNRQQPPPIVSTTPYYQPAQQMNPQPMRAPVVPVNTQPVQMIQPVIPAPQMVTPCNNQVSCFDIPFPYSTNDPVVDDYLRQCGYFDNVMTNNNNPGAINNVCTSLTNTPVSKTEALMNNAAAMLSVMSQNGGCDNQSVQNYALSNVYNQQPAMIQDPMMVNPACIPFPYGGDIYNSCYPTANALINPYYNMNYNMDMNCSLLPSCNYVNTNGQFNGSAIVDIKDYTDKTDFIDVEYKNVPMITTTKAFEDIDRPKSVESGYYYGNSDLAGLPIIDTLKTASA